MTDQTDSSARESLSAMMDNEALELELLRITKKLSEDKGLRQAWHRYHLVSSVVHSERGRDTSVTMTDLSVQIASAVELEPELVITPLADETVSRSIDPRASSNRVFAKIALAASVAVIAVFGVQQLQPGIDGSGPDNFVSDNAMANTVAANNVDVELGTSEDTNPRETGPQFQLPSGYIPPHINIRTASTAPVYSLNRPMPAQPLSYGAGTLLDKHTGASLDDAGITDTGANDTSDSETHRQIQNYLNYMMVRYAQ